MSILTDTAPRRIYLCVSDDEEHNNEPYPERYPEDEAITWSTDRPVACTVAYVREDLADQLRAECDEARADAARYRWLRDRHEYNAAAANIVQEVSGEGWDAAIDAALKEPGSRADMQDRADKLRATVAAQMKRLAP